MNENRHLRPIAGNESHPLELTASFMILDKNAGGLPSPRTSRTSAPSPRNSGPRSPRAKPNPPRTTAVLVSPRSSRLQPEGGASSSPLTASALRSHLHPAPASIGDQQIYQSSRPIAKLDHPAGLPPQVLEKRYPHHGAPRLRPRPLALARARAAACTRARARAAALRERTQRSPPRLPPARVCDHACESKPPLRSGGGGTERLRPTYIHPPITSPYSKYSTVAEHFLRSSM
jgi:hypothetical protein